MTTKELSDKVLLDLQKARLLQRLEKFTIKGESCWIWTGVTNGRGYGKFYVTNSLHYLAHRVSWYLVNGKIPDGKFLLHTCDNPRCVNPDHLHLGTQTDNMRDMCQKGRHVSWDSSGENNGAAKLTKKQVDEMRLIYAQGGSSYRKLMIRYGISKSQVSRIINRQSW
jgi:hypothetical protein